MNECVCELYNWGNVIPGPGASAVPTLSKDRSTFHMTEGMEGKWKGEKHQKEKTFVDSEA